MSTIAEQLTNPTEVPDITDKFTDVMFSKGDGDIMILTDNEQKLETSETCIEVVSEGYALVFVHDDTHDVELYDTSVSPPAFVGSTSIQRLLDAVADDIFSVESLRNIG